MTATMTNDERYSARAQACLDTLEQRLNEVERDVHGEECWRMLVVQPPGGDHIRAMLREVMLRVCWYQPRTTEAGFHMLGRFPKGEQRWLRALLNHKAEEAEHGEWARRDYLALGGNPARIDQDMSGPCFAVVGVWWHMARTADPIGYLGAEYLFEELTARVTPPILEACGRVGCPTDGLGFVIEHAVEDVKHANLIRHLVGDAVSRYPDSDRAILACFDWFRTVYPVAVWRDAHRDAVGA